MRLQGVTLRNWKGYRATRISLPDVQSGRNVVVLEGNNGAGKTSLLEALTCCLYGRAAMPLVARATAGARPDQSYDGFLERALYSGARGRPARMAVLLEFTDGEESISVERIWHFGAAGRHRSEDEEVRLGEGRDCLAVPLPEAAEVSDFVRGFVDDRLLPEHLAPFFLMDGEHLERMSGRTADQQVRQAVEAVLGAPVLRSLASDLRSYARERRRQLPQGSGRDGEQAVIDLAALEEEERTLAERLELSTNALEPLRRTRDTVVDRIGRLHGDSYRNFKQLFEERERLIRDRDAQRDELRRLLSGDLALALAGPILRQRVLDRLEHEDVAERWSSSAQASIGRFDDFMRMLGERKPRLKAERDLLESVWTETWSTRPDGVPTDLHHRHLGEAERRAVRLHLESLSAVRSDSIAELSRVVAQCDVQVLEIEQEIGRQRGLDGESQALADELNKAQTAVAAEEASHAGLLQNLAAARTRVLDARESLSKLLSADAAAAPLLAKADRAERYAELAERLVSEAMPANLDVLSDSITEAYVEMAHKSVVKRISLKPDGGVAMLDGLGGDLRAVDASAGESQVFALAVMSGLSRLAADFPIVMDTPLARLDPMHRANVLRHFANGTRQLVLLTHPAELGPDEMKVLGSHVAEVITIGAVSRPAEAG